MEVAKMPMKITEFEEEMEIRSDEYDEEYKKIMEKLEKNINKPYSFHELYPDYITNRDIELNIKWIAWKKILKSNPNGSPFISKKNITIGGRRPVFYQKEIMTPNGPLIRIGLKPPID